MIFTQSVKICFRKYVTFSGRASRSEFWWFALFTVGLGFVASGLETLINATTATPDGPRLLSSATNLVTLLPSLAVAWRRLHDIGRSGLWYPGLVLAIPLGFGLMGAGIDILLAQLVGWYFSSTLQLLILAVFGVCLLLLLVWLCKKSEPGPNTYGPNPHEVSP